MEDSLLSSSLRTYSHTISPFASFPVEILLAIIRLLPEADRLCCSRVCKPWQMAIYRDLSLWQTFTVRPSLRNTAKQVWFFEERLRNTAKGIVDVIVPLHGTEKHFSILLDSSCPFAVQNITMFSPSFMISTAWKVFGHTLLYADIVIRSTRHDYKRFRNLSIEDLLADAPNLQIFKICHMYAMPSGPHDQQPKSFGIKELTVKHLNAWQQSGPIEAFDNYPSLVKVKFKEVACTRFVNSVCSSAPLEEITLIDSPLPIGYPFPHLKYLKVAKEYRFVTAPTLPLSPHTTSEPFWAVLRTLDLQFARITSNQLAFLANGSRLLQSVTMIGVEGLDREELYLAIQQWVTLERLELRELENCLITSQLIENLKTGQFNLNSLLLEGFGEPVGRAITLLVEDRLAQQSRAKILEVQVLQACPSDIDMLEGLKSVVPSFQVTSRLGNVESVVASA